MTNVVISGLHIVTRDELARGSTVRIFEQT